MIFLKWKHKCVQPSLKKNEEIISTKQLIIPHPEIEKRKFVLQPMCDIAPYFRHPIHKKTMKQLLEDIIEVGRSPKDEAKVHFIGSIVYVCNDEYTTDEIEQYVIIDGQQRITTITLLLIALYHQAEELGDNRLAETIYEYYLINKNADDDSYKVKLKATENNERDLHYLLNKIPIPDSAYSNIKNNYNFFAKHITEDNREIIYDGFKRLLFVETYLIVVVKLS